MPFIEFFFVRVICPTKKKQQKNSLLVFSIKDVTVIWGPFLHKIVNNMPDKC